MRVVDAVAQWFDVAGIKHYFGYAGGAIWPLMDGLVDVPHIKGYQAKNEAHATHMADVYFRITGRVAPVVVSKGPGLMNTVGAVASAMHDSTALLVLAGAGSTHFLGRAGMQEMYYHGFEDAVSVFKPITKGAWMIVRPDQVVDVLNTALKVATSGRPGPVFIQIPYDIQLAEVEGEIERPSRRMATAGLRANAAEIDRVAELVATAERPVLLVGGGVNRSPGARTALGRSSTGSRSRSSQPSPRRGPSRRTIRSRSVPWDDRARSPLRAWPARPISSSPSAPGSPTTTPRTGEPG